MPVVVVVVVVCEVDEVDDFVVEDLVIVVALQHSVLLLPGVDEAKAMPTRPAGQDHEEQHGTVEPPVKTFVTEI